MKKLLLILLCVPLIFSCGENEKEIATKEGICIEGDCDNGTGSFIYDGFNSPILMLPTRNSKIFVSKYEGGWKNGKFHGIGAVTDSNGIKHITRFINGRFNGKGTVTVTTIFKEDFMTTREFIDGLETLESQYRWLYGVGAKGPKYNLEPPPLSIDIKDYFSELPRPKLKDSLNPPVNEEQYEFKIKMKKRKKKRGKE